MPSHAMPWTNRQTTFHVTPTLRKQKPPSESDARDQLTDHTATPILTGSHSELPGCMADAQ